ncbi:MAG: hypothetical protein ABI395_11760 [Sphingobium sp.]
MTIGLATQIPSMTVPTGTDMISTSGFRTLGKGAATYIRATGLPSWGQGIWWFTDAAGAQFQISELRPDLMMFGGYDDGAKAYNSSVVTGTDNAPTMNALLYYCQLYGHTTAYIPEGKFSFYDTVHVGFGDGNLGYTTRVNVEGSGPLYAGHATVSGTPGTACFAGFSDRPFFNIQGQRNCTIQGILLGGLFEKFIVTNNCAMNNGTLATACPFDDREIGNWYDPELNAAQDGRYTPYAAIAIDSFYGSRPSLTAWTASTICKTARVAFVNGKVYVCRIGGTTASSGGPSGTTSTEVDGTVTWAYMGPYSSGLPNQYVSYPDMSYPSYSGVTTQYGKGQSSKLTVKDCKFEGFIAAIALQPCDYDGNGDFLTTSDCSFIYCKYGISIGNTQSRNVRIENATGNQIHTFMEGITHGRALGRFQGPVINVSLSNVMQLFNAGAGGLAPLNFYDCYIEGLDRIGNLVGSGGGCVNFHGGDLFIASYTYNNARGIPDTQYSGTSTRQYGTLSATCPLHFYGTLISYSAVCGLFGQEIVMLGGQTRDVDIQGTAPAYYCLAHNALSGGIVTPDFGTRPTSTCTAQIESQFRARNLSDGSQGSALSQAGGIFGSATRAFGSPTYARRLSAPQLNTPVEVERAYRTFAKTQFPDMTLVGLILTGTFAGPASNADYYNILPGDVWYDNQTGKVFFVYSFDPVTRITKAVLRNGYKGPAGSETTCCSPFSTTVGNFITCSGRAFTPTAPLFYSSSANKTFVADTNTSVLLTNFFGASSILVGQRIAGTGIPANTFILGVEGTTVTLSQAATATATGVTVTVGTPASTVVGNVTTTAGSAILTAVAAAPLIPGAPISGLNIPVGNYIQSVSGTSVTMGNPAGTAAAQATASGTVSATIQPATRVLFNIGDATGGGSMGTTIQAGDFIANDTSVDYTVNSTVGVTVVAVNDTSRTITLGNVAQWPPVTNRRLRYLRMAPPANVSTP